MKLDKKGMTLIELLISVALISIVLGFMFKLILDVKNMRDNPGIATNNQVNRVEMIKFLQENLYKLDINYVEIGHKTCAQADQYFCILLYHLSNTSTDIININFYNDMQTVEVEVNKGGTFDERFWKIEEEAYIFTEVNLDLITEYNYDDYYFKWQFMINEGANENDYLDDIEIVSKGKYFENEDECLIYLMEESEDSGCLFTRAESEDISHEFSFDF